MSKIDLSKMSAAELVAFVCDETVKKSPARKTTRKVEIQPVKSVTLSNIKGSRRVIDSKVEKIESDYTDFYVRQIPAGVKKDRVGMRLKQILG